MVTASVTYRTLLSFGAFTKSTAGAARLTPALGRGLCASYRFGMAHEVSVRTAAHYRWGSGCDGWHLLASDDLSVIEERMPPGSAEQLHFHEKAHQFFYVLQGLAEIRLPSGTLQLSAGSGVDVPAGTTHQMINTSSSDVRFIVVSSPKSHGDRVLATASVELSTTEPGSA